MVYSLYYCDMYVALLEPVIVDSGCMDMKPIKSIKYFTCMCSGSLSF